mmetsp:Transcript_8120/g.18155  ORF Transcript_8120/g.18155 Transcript_8120/m.18155 type:complete len:180 (-) Transcript_8120:24-563(-)
MRRAKERTNHIYPVKRPGPSSAQRTPRYEYEWRWEGMSDGRLDPRETGFEDDDGSWFALTCGAYDSVVEVICFPPQWKGYTANQSSHQHEWERHGEVHPVPFSSAIAPSSPSRLIAAPPAQYLRQPRSVVASPLITTGAAVTASPAAREGAAVERTSNKRTINGASTAPQTDVPSMLRP